VFCQTILAAVLPPYLRHLNQQTDDSITKAREEMTVISSLSVSMRVLVSSCEPMARYRAARFQLAKVNLYSMLSLRKLYNTNLRLNF